MFGGRSQDAPAESQAAVYLRGSHGVDCVEGWKRSVREQAEHALLVNGAQPRSQMHVTLGFAFAMAFACGTGAHPVLWAIPFLSAAMLIHELPAAIWARRMRRFAVITLDATGARTAVAGAPLGATRELGLVLAGSLSNLVVAAAALFGLAHARPWTGAWHWLELARVQLWWAAAQLIPLLPLGVGRVLSRALGERARVWHALASFGFVLAVAASLAHRLELPAVFVGIGLLLLSSGRQLREALATRHDQRHGAASLLDALQRATADDTPTRAIELTTQLLSFARSAPVRTRAYKARAWAAIAADDPLAAHAALLAVPVDAVDLHLLASYLTTCRRQGEAVRLLESARRLRLHSRETTKLLAELYYRRGQLGAVAELAAADRQLLSVDDFARISAALREPAPTAVEAA